MSFTRTSFLGWCCCCLFWLCHTRTTRFRSTICSSDGESVRLMQRCDSFQIRESISLNEKIIEVVNERALAHALVANLAHTSRTRVTAILNRNTHDISMDLMLWVLGSLGVHAKLEF